MTEEQLAWCAWVRGARWDELERAAASLRQPALRSPIGLGRGEALAGWPPASVGEALEMGMCGSAPFGFWLAVVREMAGRFGPGFGLWMVGDGRQRLWGQFPRI